MDAKEAIDRFQNVYNYRKWKEEDGKNPIEPKVERQLEAMDIIISLATRMAMYEWWLSLTREELVKYQIYFELSLHPFDPQIEAMVMEAWKENT